MKQVMDAAVPMLRTDYLRAEDVARVPPFVLSGENRHITDQGPRGRRFCGHAPPVLAGGGRLPRWAA